MRYDVLIQYQAQSTVRYYRESSELSRHSISCTIKGILQTYIIVLKKSWVIRTLSCVQEQ